MRQALTLTAIRTLVLLILTASAALLYDYTRPLPAFCEIGAGCEAVRASSFAYVLGIPQPAVGLLAYMGVFGITLLGHERRRRYLLPITALGGVLGGVFLVVQAVVIHRFCSLCVTVDVSSMLVALLAWAHRDATGHDGGVPRFGWSLLAALAVMAPLLFGAARPDPSVPGAVARFWVPEKLTIVEISDFECPFCRALHPALSKAVAPYGNRVRLVRLSAPLRSHPHAKTAAKAYVCAKNLGKGEEMADALFQSKNIGESGCRTAAAQVGLDKDAFAACFDGSQGEDLMQRDVDTARTIGFRGLPTLWVGSKNLIGLRSASDLREVIDEQLAGGTKKLPSLSPKWMWGILGAVYLGIALASLVRKPAEQRASER